jgi:pSer/pThr/pTyr-binding forkhead associated (FHA) protein
MDVSITDDDTVSRDRHSIVVYEPKMHQFLIQVGESKELSYLNGQAVLTPQELKPRDVITVGATKLMFFSCCDENFNWEMLQTI